MSIDNLPSFTSRGKLLEFILLVGYVLDVKLQVNRRHVMMNRSYLYIKSTLNLSKSIINFWTYLNPSIVNKHKIILHLEKKQSFTLDKAFPPKKGLFLFNLPFHNLRPMLASYRSLCVCLFTAAKWHLYFYNSTFKILLCKISYSLFASRKWPKQIILVTFVIDLKRRKFVDFFLYLGVFC